MIDSARAQADAQRYRAGSSPRRSRERGGDGMRARWSISRPAMAMLQDSQEDEGGYHHTTGDNFEIKGDGRATGVLDAEGGR